MKIAGILGGIVLIGNACNVISKFVRPALNNQHMTEDNARRIADIETHLNKDCDTIQKLEDSNKLLVRCMLVMMNHMIDGNHIEDMKHTRDEIQDLFLKI